MCEWRAVSPLLGTLPHVLLAHLVLRYPVETCFAQRLWEWGRLSWGSGERQETGEGISDEMIHEQSYEDNREEGTASAKVLRHKYAGGVDDLQGDGWLEP